MRMTCQCDLTYMFISAIPSDLIQRIDPLLRCHGPLLFEPGVAHRYLNIGQPRGSVYSSVAPGAPVAPLGCRIAAGKPIERDVGEYVLERQRYLLVRPFYHLFCNPKSQQNSQNLKRR